VPARALVRHGPARAGRRRQRRQDDERAAAGERRQSRVADHVLEPEVHADLDELDARIASDAGHHLADVREVEDRLGTRGREECEQKNDEGGDRLQR